MPAFPCPVCSHEFATISKFNEHKWLCNFRNKSAKEIADDCDVAANMPTHAELVSIVWHQFKKIEKLEEKMQEIQQYHNRRQKLDIAPWLTANRRPAFHWAQWIDICTNITIQHIPALLESHQPIDFFGYTWDCFVAQHKLEPHLLPIICFTKNKKCTFYCYTVAGEDQDSTQPQWNTMQSADWKLFLHKLITRIYEQLCNWGETNASQFAESNTHTDKFNRIVGKIADIQLNPDASISKLKQQLAERTHCPNSL